MRECSLKKLICNYKTQTIFPEYFFNASSRCKKKKKSKIKLANIWRN